jgi:hypothetical protein
MSQLSEREIQIEKVIGYFKSNQWKRLISFWQRPDITHMHVYLDTSIHPYKSFQPIFEKYLEMRGWPKDREMDRIPSVSSKQPCLHNVHAKGLYAHIDFFIRFKEGVGLAPMTPEDGEHGRNLAWCGEENIRTFIEQFDWKTNIDSKVDMALKNYFISEHWMKGMEIIRDPNMAHLHINVDTSIHPNIIRKYALDAISIAGWTIQHGVHAVYEEDTGKYGPISKKVDNGKTVFLCEKVFDIVWWYNPDVLISPKSAFPYQKNPIDPMLIELLKPFEAKGICLTSDEIDKILETIKPIEGYAVDSWRKVPL